MGGARESVLVSLSLARPNRCTMAAAECWRGFTNQLFWAEDDTMGTGRKVIPCEAAGCPRKLVVNSDLHPSEAVRTNDDWAYVGGMVLCPKHAEHRRPWLS